LLLLFSQGNRWLELVGNGELALYSAAFLASAMYIVVKDIRQSAFVQRPLFVLVSLVGLLAAAVIFAGPTAIRTLKVSPPVDPSRLLTFSVPLFAASVVFAFLVGVLDSTRVDPNVREIDQDQQEQLNQDFDQLEGQ